MLSLRQRFLLATGLLLGAQGASTALALGSWRQVLEATDREQELADWRVEVAGLGSAIREQYVHQAHVYIEGGPGHLDHHASTSSDAGVRLDRIARLPLAPADAAAVEAIAVDLVLLDAWFAENVAPEARARTLDRARAAELHATTEAVAGRLTERVEELLASLDAASAQVRERAQSATARAWWATAALTLGGLLLVAMVARALARAVLAPVDAIRAAAARVGEADPQHGDELGEIAAAFDAITDRLSDEQERRVKAERLAALGEMSAAIAHELMNPLAVILGQARMSDDPALVPIREEAEHARRVVEGLLGFARPTEEPAGAVELGRAARDAADRALLVADSREVDVRVDVTADATVIASPSAVRQVLDNLVRNAVEASGPGGAVEIQVGEGPVIRVLDRGSGLPERVRARMYEPFVTGKPQGTGLGLAVCQRIVRAQGGTLAHADRPGGGTEAIWRLESR